MDSSYPKISFERIDQASDAAVIGEIKEVHEDDGWIVVGAEETDARRRDSVPSNHCPAVESDFHECRPSRNQNQDSMTENVEAEETCPLNQASHFLLGPVQIEKQNKNSLDATAAVSSEPILKEAQNNPEDFQHHGIHRRSLQLEDNPYTVISRPTQSPSNSGAPKSPLKLPCTPIKGKETEKIQPPYPQSRNNTVNIPKPSGIGLHLNSIINVLQAGSGAIVHTKSAQSFNFSIRGMKSTPTINSHLSDTSKSSTGFSPPENVSACTDDRGPKIHDSAAVNSITSSATVIIKSSNNLVDDQSAQGNKSVCTDIKTDGILDEFKSNPKKKRKRFSDSSNGDGDGCKRCHCRKSKCLKLYCDCFAAGLYCAGSCACQGCYNRPEYEDKVLESRQQIESRNPLAFAPKIVKHIIEPSASSSGNFSQEDETLFTPSSARHKRGCNCKKSMCLKKYCECYHANVGCSVGCRCEGCKNVFGRKGEYSLEKDALSKEGTSATTAGSNGGLCHSELTPRTPAVHHRKDVREGCLRPRRCFQSPESGVTSATPNAMTPLSPINSDNNAMISEGALEDLDLVSSQEELYFGNVETPGEFSTVRHQIGKTGNPPGANQYSSAGFLSLLCSPGTPMAQSGASRPLKVVDLDGELCNNTMQDDTPDILRDSPAPPNAVKSSSPNKKRVSPPHASRHELGLCSLNGLRTGRKFILKAVPSIPPLTPCAGSKRGLPQERNSPQDGSSHK
ncbi:protein tesmin/TSO1-like CXC 2 isoform X2 [Salvia miltiorrhiza]|uniref:protein tesmin/TSO1-like CXC 2 isoform X2 n=1 Tax=Salvia miltiorrhiza TaxID=226208 RepID=UPI0025AD2385|nr:protein tesmin/TSO1-like CXC 2 isoform X2 [Salvia miltiorrhiza]